MAVFITNRVPTSKQDAWYAFKAAALSSTTTPGTNWTVRTSSTGAGGVYAQLGDVITSATSLGDRAWFVLRGKGVLDGGVLYRRELCFQLDAAGDVRVTYSPRSGFTAGTPSTTQVPSALDQQLLYGGGTDAAPTFTALLPGSGVWMQGRFSEVDDAFFVLTYLTGGSLPTCLFYLEATPALYALGGALVDEDPCVLYARTGLNCATRQDLASEVRGAMGLLSLDVPAQALWCRLAASYSAVLDSSDVPQPTLPGGLTTPPSPHYVVPTYRQEPLRYGRRTGLSGQTMPGDVGNVSTVGEKGEGCYLRWAGTSFAVPQLVGLADVSSGSSQCCVVLAAGSLFFPWEVGAAPSL